MPQETGKLNTVYTCSKVGHRACDEFTTSQRKFRHQPTHWMTQVTDISVDVSLPYWSFTHCSQLNYQASIHPACSAPERMSSQWLDQNIGCKAVETFPTLLLPACKGPEQQEHLLQSSDQCCQTNWTRNIIDVSMY